MIVISLREETELLLELSPVALALSDPRIDPLCILVPLDDGCLQIKEHVAQLLVFQVLSVLLKDVRIVISVVTGRTLLHGTLDLVASRSDRKQEHDREYVNHCVKNLVHPSVSHVEVWICPMVHEQIVMNKTAHKNTNCLFKIGV